MLLLILSGASYGATVNVYLKSEVTNKVMPDTTNITMWGFASCNSTFTSCTSASVPGPLMTATEGDTLIVHLKNSLNLLSAYLEPVSIVIPGQKAGLNPVKFQDADGRWRVKSFTDETPANNSTVVTYTWTGVKSGTYLYQSGTHPALQIQMGLYGPLQVFPSTPGQAYNDPSTAFNIEKTVLFSEIDPALHTAVASNTYGTSLTSTINYAPKYFLINGEPYSSSVPPLLTGNIGDIVLLRFLNAGLETHVPVMHGLYMELIAEDSNQNPYPKEQYSVILPAGKTLDALITLPGISSIPLYDRMLSLTNGTASPGGMMTFLHVNVPVPPVANPDSYSVNEDTLLNVLAPGVLQNDTGVGTLTAVPASNVQHGTLNLNSDGSFTYMPALNYNGPDSFSYKANNGASDSNVTTVTMTVNPLNDPPVALNDAYIVTINNTFNAAAPGVLGNDADPDNTTLTANLVTDVQHGTLTLNTNGSFTYTPAAGFVGTDTFTYTAGDGSLSSNEAIVTLNVQSLINVVNPNGGENWAVGTTQTIRWTYSGIVGSFVKIDLYKGGVFNRAIVASASIGTGGNGYYNWPIPVNLAAGADYRIKVTSGTLTDISNNNFTIAAPTITVVAPNGGDIWARGMLRTITWTYTGNPGTWVKIELFKGGVLNRTITSSASTGSGGNGSFSWLIPLRQITGNDFKIKVTSTTNATVTDTSNNFFTVR
jgi:VCBS repeat-containing protein